MQFRNPVGVELPWIHDSVRVQCPLDCLHQLNGPATKLFIQVFLLSRHHEVGGG
jgi:hypothetical protein